MFEVGNELEIHVKQWLDYFLVWLIHGKMFQHRLTTTAVNLLGTDLEHEITFLFH